MNARSRLALALLASFALNANASVITVQVATTSPAAQANAAAYKLAVDAAIANPAAYKGSKSVASGDPNANYIYYGVREFAMTAISNGLGLHECFIPYDATFLVFSDYARNAVRMSALMGAHAIHVYTHDSIGLGEDGPTHQPIEHLA